jgi:hypothetical protein
MTSGGHIIFSGSSIGMFKMSSSPSSVWEKHGNIASTISPRGLAYGNPDTSYFVGFYTKGTTCYLSLLDVAGGGFLY